MAQVSPNSSNQSTINVNSDPYAVYGGGVAKQAGALNPYAAYGGTVAQADPYAAYGGKATSSTPTTPANLQPGFAAIRAYEQKHASTPKPSAAQNALSGFEASIPKFTFGEFGHALKYAIEHPVNSAQLLFGGITQPMAELQQQAKESFKQGHYLNAAGEYTTGIIPMLGPLAHDAYTTGNKEGLAAETGFLAGSALQMLPVEGLAGGTPELAAGVRSTAAFRPVDLTRPVSRGVPEDLGVATPANTDPLSLKRNPPDWRRYGAQAGEVSEQTTNEMRRNPPNWQRIAQVQEMPERASRQAAPRANESITQPVTSPSLPGLKDYPELSDHPLAKLSVDQLEKLASYDPDALEAAGIPASYRNIALELLGKAPKLTLLPEEVAPISPEQLATLTKHPMVAAAQPGLSYVEKGGTTWAIDPTLSPNPVSIDLPPGLARDIAARAKLIEQGHVALKTKADSLARLKAQGVAEAQNSGTSTTGTAIPATASAAKNMDELLAYHGQTRELLISVREQIDRTVNDPNLPLRVKVARRRILKKALDVISNRVDEEEAAAQDLQARAGTAENPVRVEFDSQGNVVDADGRHRVIAALERGDTTIPVETKLADGTTQTLHVPPARAAETMGVTPESLKATDEQQAAFKPAPAEAKAVVPEKLPLDMQDKLNRLNYHGKQMRREGLTPEQISQHKAAGENVVRQLNASATVLGRQLGKEGAQEFGTRLEAQAVEAERQADLALRMHAAAQHADTARAVREGNRGVPIYTESIDEETGKPVRKLERVDTGDRAVREELNSNLLGNRTKEVPNPAYRKSQEVDPQTRAKAEQQLAAANALHAEAIEDAKKAGLTGQDALDHADAYFRDSDPEGRDYDQKVKELKSIIGSPTKRVSVGKGHMTEGNTAPLAVPTTKDLKTLGVKRAADLPGKARELQTRAHQLRAIARQINKGSGISEEPTPKSLGSAASGGEAGTRQSINEAALGQTLQNVQTKADLNKALDAAADHLVKNDDPRMRGPVADDITRQLAQEMDWDTKTILASKPHTALNDAQQLAALETLNKAGDSVLDAARGVRNGTISVDDYAKQAAHYFDVRDTVDARFGAEAGRALRARRLGKVVDLPPDKDLSSGKLLTFPQRLSRFALQLIAKAPKEERAGLAREFAGIDQADTTAMSRFIHKISPATTADKLYEAWQNGLLSGGALPKKLIGDFTMTLKAPLEKLLGGDPQGAVHTIIGTLQGGADAIEAAAQTFRTEIDPNADEFSTPTVAIKGKTGRIVRMPRRAIAAVTSFFHTINKSASIAEQAAKIARSEGRIGEQFSQRVADLRAHPTDAMRVKATDYADRQTFSNQGSLAKIASHLRRTPYVGKIAFPFARTPANIAEEAFNASPFGLGKSLIQRDLLKRPVDAQMIGKGVLGTSLALWALYKAHQGLLTGGGTNLTPAQRETLEATGWQPYSVKVGNHYVSIRYWEPIAPTLMAAADATEAKRYDSPEVLQNLFAAARDTAETLPFMYTVTNLASAMQNPHAAGHFLGKEVGSLIPTGVADIANIADSRVRTPKSFGQEIENRIPGLTGQVPAMIGPSGEPMQRPTSNLGGFNPYPVTSHGADKVVNEFARMGESVERPPTKEALPRHGLPKGVRVPSTPITLDEASKLQQQDTKAIYNAMQNVMDDPGWDSMSDDSKRRRIAEIRRGVASTRYRRLMDLRQKAGASAQ